LTTCKAPFEIGYNPFRGAHTAQIPLDEIS